MVADRTAAVTAALAAALPDLCCPVCRQRLRLDAGAVRCDAGHAYDLARQGYLNLLPGGAHTGTADRPDMVRARREFLAAGHYAAVADRIAAVAGDAGLVVDAGTGTGYYLGRVLDTCGGRGIGLDISKHAARLAARAHPRAAAVVADVWGALPVRSGAADVLLDVFSPRNPAEFHRVLRPGGTLVVATPGVGHLGELVEVLGMLSVEEAKTDRLDGVLAGSFERTAREDCVATLRLSRPDAGRVALMGPSAFHLDRAGLARRVAALPEIVPVTLSVTVSAYRRTP